MEEKYQATGRGATAPHLEGGRTPRWVRREGEREEGRVGGVAGEAWPPEATEGRRPAEWDTGGGGGRWGGPAEMGSPVPLPQPGPGLPLTQPHGDRGLGPDSQCARRLRRRRQGRGTGGGGAAAAAAAPAGGSGAEGPSRGRRGLRLQRTETAGGRGGETRALRRRDAAAAVSPSGAGPGHPPSPRQPGGERRTTPTSTSS